MNKLKELKKTIQAVESITLEDIMIAIENPNISFRYFYRKNICIQIEKGGKLLGVWQLNKSLENQETKTLDFLHNLICKDEK